MKTASAVIVLGLLVVSLIAEPVVSLRVLHGAREAETDTPVAAAPVESPPPEGPVSAEAVGDLANQLLVRYLSNAELAAWGTDFVTRCSSIARKFSIGKSYLGSDLWVIEIAAQPGVSDGKPNFKYVANMHGDEPGGRALLPQLAEWLCSNAATDPRASRIIQGMHLFLMPTMNPDGFARRTRANGAGADLNRNFPSWARVCPNQSPEQCPASLLQRASGYTPQPETQAIMTWSLNTPFTAAANLHEGAIVANYPWDGYNDGSLQSRGTLNLTPDHAEYVHLSKTYASAHAYMGRSNAFPQGITNGAAWYPIYGSMQDWDYTAAGCMEITLELSQNKFPYASSLQGMWNDNVNALLALPIAAVLGGASGRVTAADTGAPLVGAVVAVEGIKMNTAARGAHGTFNKPLAPGTYTIRVSAPGYRTESTTVVVPANGAGVVQDFKLVRTSRRAGRRAVGLAAGTAAVPEVEQVAATAGAAAGAQPAAALP